MQFDWICNVNFNIDNFSISNDCFLHLFVLFPISSFAIAFLSFQIGYLYNFPSQNYLPFLFVVGCLIFQLANLVLTLISSHVIVLNVANGVLACLIYFLLSVIRKRRISRNFQFSLTFLHLILVLRTGCDFLIAFIENSHSQSSISVKFLLTIATFITFTIYLLTDLLILNSKNYVVKSSVPPSPDDRFGLGVASPKNIFQMIFFTWVTPVLKLGQNDKLETPNDLFQLPENVSVWKETNRLEHCILKSKQKAQRVDGDFRLLPTFVRHYGWMISSHFVFRFVTDLSNIINPLLLNLLIVNFSSPSFSTWTAIGLSCLMAAVSLVAAVADQQYNIFGIQRSLRIKAGFMTFVYQKALSVNQAKMSKFTRGQVQNFLCQDSDNISLLPTNVPLLFSMPISILLILVLLYLQLGLAFLAAVAICILLIPVNKWLSSSIMKYRMRWMQFKDKRIKVMTELLNGIRAIKFSAYEKVFTRKVTSVRSEELRELILFKFLDGFCVYLWAALPTLVTFAIFSTYILTDHILTVAKVFTCISLINLLILPLNSFPWVLNTVIESYVSLKRLEAFFALDDFDPDKYYTASPEHIDDSVNIQFSNTTCRWDTEAKSNFFSDREATTPLIKKVIAKIISSNTTSQPEDVGHSHDATLQKLRNITTSIKQNSLVGLAGTVGAGKSSLFSALCGEMILENGKLFVGDLESGFGVVDQETWLQSGTIRANIIMDRAYESNFYNSVIHACALVDDIKVLPHGDLTQVGPLGITLSGGQKTRVSLARAVYQQKQIYLLDDPLSAVDAHVAAHIFENCILAPKSSGGLEGTTRILSTHHLKFLKRVDVVILMEKGEISKIGPPESVLSQEILSTLCQQTSSSAKNDNQISHDQATKEEAEVVEEHVFGSLTFGVYLKYFGYAGKALCTLFLVFFVLMQASVNFTDIFLSYWTTQTSKFLNETSNHSDNGTETIKTFQMHYLYLYALIMIFVNLFTLVRSFTFIIGTVAATKRLHEAVLDSVLRFKLDIFSHTPVGRILNRFSNDVNIVDDFLPFTMNILLRNIIVTLGTIIVTVALIPLLTPIIFFLAFLFYRVQLFYRKTSRELRRMANISMSPVYSHFEESVAGASVIRAMRLQSYFETTNQKVLYGALRTRYVDRLVQRWLAIRLQLIGICLLVIVLISGVLFAHFAPDMFHSGMLALVITYCLNIRGLLQQLVGMGAEFEKDMVSVERLVDYEQETNVEKIRGSIVLPQNWPPFGDIQFRNVTVRYKQHLEPALHNLSFNIRGGEKVGIVGRTGAGKSSLLLTLFRLMNFQEGAIFIDNIDISHIPVREFRARLSIIPQDPFIFKSSVRSNLDIHGCFDDSDIWRALRKAHVAEAVERLGGLDVDVGEKGCHFSAGQKQLICLARALLTDSKILCMDEATSNVDYETDSLIQKTVRTEFHSRTVITIAHRINTIVDYDRVIVLQNGEIVENASPKELLADKNSLFSTYFKL